MVASGSAPSCQHGAVHPVIPAARSAPQQQQRDEHRQHPPAGPQPPAPPTHPSVPALLAQLQQGGEAPRVAALRAVVAATEAMLVRGGVARAAVLAVKMAMVRGMGYEQCLAFVGRHFAGALRLSEAGQHAQAAECLRKGVGRLAGKGG